MYSNEDGYRPIKTTVEVAKSTPDHDRFCMLKADTLCYYIEKWMNYEGEGSKIVKFMNTYTPEDNIKDIVSHNIYVDSINILKKEIRKYVRSMDSTQRIGYVITQEFETYERNYKCTFVVDKDFHKIFNEDEFLNYKVNAECTLYWTINDELPRYEKCSDECIASELNYYMYKLSLK
jgi:hypothetical protein